MELRQESSWAEIPSDILYIILECASIGAFLNPRPQTLGSFNAEPLGIHRKDRYSYIVQRYKDQGMAPFFGICRSWRSMATLGPLKASIVVFYIQLFNAKEEDDLSNVTDLIKDIQKRAEESQIEIWFGPYGTTADKQLQLFLRAVAPYVRQLELAEFRSAVRNQQGAITHDDRLLLFPKLLGLTMLETFAAVPILALADAPRLLQLRVRASELASIAVSNLRPLRLFISPTTSPTLPTSLYTKIGDRLRFLELDRLPEPNSDVGSQTGWTTWDDMVALPYLTHLSLLSLPGLGGFRSHVRAFNAPRLVALRAVVVPSPFTELVEVTDVFASQPILARYTKLSELTLQGMCLCHCFAVADSSSCPNLRHLWITDRGPNFICRPISHWDALGLSGRMCFARTIHVISNHSKSSNGPQLAVSSIQLPEVESLVIQWDFLSVVDIISAGWDKHVVRHPRLRCFVLRNWGFASAVYTGVQASLSLISLTVDYYNVRPQINHDVDVQTVMLDVPHTIGPPYLCQFSSASTLIFVIRRYGKTSRGHLGQLEKYIDFHLLGKRSQSRNKGIKASIKGGLKKLSGKLNPPNPIPFPSLSTLVICTHRPRPFTCFADKELVSKLRDLASARISTGDHFRITEIRCTLHLEHDEDKAWFAGHGVRWTLIPFGAEAVSRIYYCDSELPVRKKNDLDPGDEIFGEWGSVRQQEVGNPVDI